MFVRVQRFPMPSLFGPISNVDRNIDEVLNNFWRGSAAGQPRRYPSIDIAEYDNESVIVAEMPGVLKEDLKLAMEDGQLTIAGEKKAAHLAEKSSWVKNEIGTGAFSRTIQLPHDVKVDAITAELTNGVLRVTLPKADEVRAREIKVQ